MSSDRSSARPHHDLSSAHDSRTPPADLAAYGWNDSLEHEFAAHRAAGLIPARIAAVDRGRCDAVTAGGTVRADLPRAAAGADSVAAPCTGDWAALDPAAPIARVVALLPRRGVIVRASAGRDSQGQPLAANVDTAIIAVPATTKIKPGKIERLLALAWEGGAVPVVALTKIDLLDSADAARAVAEAAAAAPGTEVVAVSATEGTGVDRLAAVIAGTVVLLGPSGAGKSTLANALLDGDVLATGAVRAQDGKGRHTTVRRVLLPLPVSPPAVLIDTPGLRGVGLYDADDGLSRTFPEIEELAAGCRFTDCAHDTEPGCAVRAAIQAGELTERRFAGYVKLRRENEWAAARSDARLQADRRRQRKEITGSLRELYRQRGRR